MRVELGCMNRPWGRFTFDEALAGIASAGFEYFGFLGQQGRQLVAPTTPPEELDSVADQLKRFGLKPRFVFSATPVERPEDEAAAHARRLIDNARRVGIPILLEMGQSKPELYDAYFSVMRVVAPYAAERGVTIALKPHGGLATTGDDCLRAMQAVEHPAFRLAFDPGNLLYYAGQDPVAELPKLAPYVVAMCVKDERGGSGSGRTVDITPGDGDVDFPAIFRILNDHGFEGKPAIVETLAGSAIADVNREAKRAYTYLTQVLAAI
jgi:sugar phosphate isomerase/epimerase